MTGPRRQFDPSKFPALSDREKLEFLVQAATFAPSSHNSQPWLFSLSGKTILVSMNPKRVLQASDANHRQLFISLGCAIQNILTAADYYSLRPQVRWSWELAESKPQGTNVASIEFADLNMSGKMPTGGNQDHLALSIPYRHTNRNPYEKDPVPPEVIDTLTKMSREDIRVDIATDQERKTKLANIVLRATDAAFSNRAFRQELSHWIKPSLKKYHDGLVGYNLGIPTLLSFIFPLILRFVNVSKAQTKQETPILKATPAFGVISTKDDDKISWLWAGQFYETIALWMNQHDLKTAVAAAPIQIGEFYKEVQSVFGITFRPQVFFRLGYCKKVSPFSPRLTVKEVMK